MCHHFVKEKIKKRDFIPIYISSENNVSNLLNKPLLRDIIRNFASVISQTLKHVQDMFDFNMISNSYGYLALFVSKTPLEVWYFIMDLISLNLHGYLALIKSKSTVIFICFHCLIISFKLCKFTWTLHSVFPFLSLNSYVVFYY